MLFRSTNSKFTHFQGDVISNIDDSSHGVMLSGGSTGGVVESVGDETNIALTVRGKGAGGVAIGNSSQTVTFSGPFASTGIASTHINLNSTKISIGGSTAYLMTVRRVRVDFSVPTMAASAGAEVGDITVTGLTTNAVVTIAPRGALNSSVAGVSVTHAFCSTAGQIHLTLLNAGTTITGSTMSAYAMIHDFNIPVP